MPAAVAPVEDYGQRNGADVVSVSVVGGVVRVRVESDVTPMFMQALGFGPTVTVSAEASAVAGSLIELETAY